MIPYTKDKKQNVCIKEQLRMDVRGEGINTHIIDALVFGIIGGVVASAVAKAFIETKKR